MLLALHTVQKKYQKPPSTLEKLSRSKNEKHHGLPNLVNFTENSVTIPDDLKEFLFTLLTGSTEFSGVQSCSPKVQRLITSFGASGGRQKPPKHVLLPFAVKSLFNNVHCAFKSWQQPHATNFPSPTTFDIRPFISMVSRDRRNRNGIAAQAYHFGPHPPSASTPNIM